MGISGEPDCGTLCLGMTGPFFQLDPLMRQQELGTLQARLNAAVLCLRRGSAYQGIRPQDLLVPRPSTES